MTVTVRGSAHAEPPTAPTHMQSRMHHVNDQSDRFLRRAVAYMEEDKVLEITGYVSSNTSCYSFYGDDGEISGAG